MFRAFTLQNADLQRVVCSSHYSHKAAMMAKLMQHGVDLLRKTYFLSAGQQ